MVNQQELRQKVNRLESLNQQLESFKEQIEFIDEKIEEHEKAKKTMKAYSEKEEGADLLVPVGGSSFLQSKVGANSKVIIDLGADVSAEKEVDEAIEILEKRKQEFEEKKEDVEEEHDELEQESQELEQEVRKEYQELQSQGQAQM